MNVRASTFDFSLDIINKMEIIRIFIALGLEQYDFSNGIETLPQTLIFLSQYLCN